MKSKKNLIIGIVLVVVVVLVIVIAHPKSKQNNVIPQQQPIATTPAAITGQTPSPTKKTESVHSVTTSTTSRTPTTVPTKSYPPTVTTLTPGTVFSGGCGSAPCQNPLPASAVLNGSFNANGSGTETWFEYWDQTVGGAIRTTAKVKQNGTQGNVSETIYNLIQGDTYAYQVVAQNIAGTAKGSIKTLYVPVPPGAAQ